MYADMTWNYAAVYIGQKTPLQAYVNVEELLSLVMGLIHACGTRVNNGICSLVVGIAMYLVSGLS